MDSKQFCKIDLNSVWHPCMQMRDFEKIPLIPIKKATGVYLYDFDGNRYIDSISSWWVNNLGHNNKTINKALKEQLKDFAHIMSANFTHKPMVALAEGLLRHLKEPLKRVFFADNGSSAVEAALKMSFQYHKNRGEIKDIFISFENSYHGETLGALSVGDVALYKKSFKEILIKTTVSKAPKDKSETQTKAALLELKKNISEHKGRVGAVILEPLVQCAGGMTMHSAEFVKGVKEICDAHKIHLILDEIAVGFGRTGTMFAYEQAAVTPDIICLSKGITGGYLPLSAVVCTGEIYDAFLDEGVEKAFLHSHSYSGNALGCAAANAVLEIFEREKVLDSLKPKIELISKKLTELSKLEFVKNPRQTGMIAAFEVESKVERVSLSIFKEGLKHGIFVRPLGNTVYIMPPLIISKKEIESLFHSLEITIKKVVS